MISSQEGVASKLKVLVTNVLQIWLMLRDRYEFGLKENSLQISGMCQEQILKYFVQTAATLSFHYKFHICNSQCR